MYFQYGINFKYEGILSHSFDRFYVVTKFILLTIDNIKIMPIIFDMECSYINIQLEKNIHAVKHLPHMQIFFQNNTIDLLLKEPRWFL